MEPHKQYTKQRGKSPGPSRFAETPKVSLFQSPQMIAVLILGLALVLIVPYMAFRTIPGSDKPLIASTKEKDPNATLNLEEFTPLPEDLKEGSRGIFLSEDSVQPEPLNGLPEASGFGLIFPVTEAVEAQQPGLSWNMFAPAPYSVTVKNKTGEVIAHIEGLQLTSWLVPLQLDRGATYTWSVTASNKETETASFLVLGAEAFAQWQKVRASMANSHLALGTVAEQLGMLTIAENEYKAAAKVYPQAEAPGRMLNNVMALRDPSVKDNAPVPLLEQ